MGRCLESWTVRVFWKRKSFLRRQFAGNNRRFVFGSFSVQGMLFFAVSVFKFCVLSVVRNVVFYTYPTVLTNGAIRLVHNIVLLTFWLFSVFVNVFIFIVSKKNIRTIPLHLNYNVLYQSLVYSKINSLKCLYDFFMHFTCLLRIIIIYIISKTFYILEDNTFPLMAYCYNL